MVSDLHGLTVLLLNTDTAYGHGDFQWAKTTRDSQRVVVYESDQKRFHHHNMKNYYIDNFADIEPTECPCGTTRRAFVDAGDAVATIHMVDISQDSRTHYHKKLTEIYMVLDGEGHMELDGEIVPVQPMSVIYIKPGCRHRAIGKMRIVNIPVPAFDPDDEWFDD